jgi:dUTP pyrophosphatase
MLKNQFEFEAFWGKLFALEAGYMPVKAYANDSAFDLFAKAGVILSPGDTCLIKTNAKIAFKQGYCGLVLSRSGLALHSSVAVLNAPGLIDESYIGELGVILHNFGNKQFEIKPLDRIAQLLIIENKLTTGLANYSRGESGFGSTGIA